MKIRCIAFICAIFLPISSFAVDINGNYAIWGVGKKSCYSYQKKTSDNDIQKYKDYVNGFLTSYNIFTRDTYSISGKMTQKNIFKWINNYCEKNPMFSFEAVLTNFILDNYDKRAKSPRPKLGL